VSLWLNIPSLFVFVCFLALLCKNCWTIFHRIRWKGGTWATELDFRGNPGRVTLGLWLWLTYHVPIVSTELQLGEGKLIPYDTGYVALGYWLMRGMVTLPQSNQELLVVKNQVGRPQASLG